MAGSSLTIAELSENHTSGHGLAVCCKSGHLGSTGAHLGAWQLNYKPPIGQ